MSSLLTLGLIGFLGFLCQWVSHRVKLPAILFLLMVGILLGPILLVIEPDALFGELLFPFISLSVAVILFEGALTLEKKDLAEIGRPVRQMVTLGVVISAVLMTVATKYLMSLSWSLSALFGAIMVVTGPTVIMPMLKVVRPTSKISNVLRWEGIVIDPIGALVAVLVFEWIVASHSAAGFADVFLVFGGTVLAGLLIGLVVGYLFGVVLRNHYIPERLQNFASLALVCLVFAVSDSLMHESGLLAVTVMGMLLANMRDVHIHSILEFKEDLTVVFVSALFIVLAARLDINAFVALGWSGFLLLMTMQFIVRPLKVMICFFKSDFNWREKLMVSWIGPRGIVAAAVSAVFALKLETIGFEGAEVLVPLAFAIIIGTVVFQSLTARPVARMLGVAMPNTHGVMIVGANPFSIALASALDKEGVQNIVCDTNWDKLREARLVGLATYYGNPSSEHALTHIDMSPFGYMLGLSNHFEYNISQANSFQDEFGSRNVLVLPPNQSVKRFKRHVARTRFSGRLLFDRDASFTAIKKRLNAGDKIKVTELSDEFSHDDWRRENAQALEIFVLKPNGDIEFNTSDVNLAVEPDDKLFYLSDEGDLPA